MRLHPVRLRVVIRLALLYRTGGRPLLQPPHLESDRHIQHESDLEEEEEEEGRRGGEGEGERTWVGTRTQKSHPTLSAIMGEGDSSLYKFLGSRVLRPEVIINAKYLVGQVRGRMLTGEVLFILRPLFYSK